MSDKPNIINALKKAGMIVEKSADKQYDRFRDRIMFPILDRRGRTIAFGGRIIDEGEPKYLNSPETPVFHKGYELYGFYEARQAVRDLQRIIVVEGYMDVVALAQNGIEYAVASLGTATTQDQIQKVFRSVNEIIFCYDGDRAGHKAAWRALENTLPIIRDGIEARFLFLPDGEDPDTMIRKEGREAFEKRVQKAIPLSQFLFDNLLADVDIESMDGKAKLAKNAKPLLAKLPESVFKDLMYQRLSELVGVSDDKLKSDQSTKQEVQQTVQRKPVSTREIKQNAMRDAIALLLQYPDLAIQASVPETFESAPMQGFGLLYALYKTIANNPELSSSALLERWRNEKDFEILQKLVQRNIHGTEDKQGRVNVFNDAIKALIKKYNDERFEVLDNKLRGGGLSEEEMEEYKALLTQ